MDVMGGCEWLWARRKSPKGIGNAVIRMVGEAVRTAVETFVMLKRTPGDQFALGKTCRSQITNTCHAIGCAVFPEHNVPSLGPVITYASAAGMSVTGIDIIYRSLALGITLVIRVSADPATASKSKVTSSSGVSLTSIGNGDAF